ncbi:hypothetical protein BKA64DRAFT_750934 [Cadophora sp. MPI-SDFR-AT-0126]|nr:hypothetical protein BKA64DRAFT_750934 [Leotiomycetes sp. MPI-SDFR-AT-0126]
MLSTTTDIGPILASALRVSRGLISAYELISAWPSLHQKALQCPQTLFEVERRLFFDRPDEDEEADNLRAATTLSRDQLLDKAISSPDELTAKEVAILDNRFWTARTTKERSDMVKALANTSDEGIEKFYDAHSLGRGQVAFAIGAREHWKRARVAEDNLLEVAAQAALPYAKQWIQQIFYSKKPHWGFIYLYNISVQQLGDEKIQEVENAMYQFFRHAHENNGSLDIIDTKWALVPFKGPDDAHAPDREEADYKMVQYFARHSEIS